jgi:hypothetical protein
VWGGQSKSVRIDKNTGEGWQLKPLKGILIQ